jgi:hypothetical protein
MVIKFGWPHQKEVPRWVRTIITKKASTKTAVPTQGQPLDNAADNARVQVVMAEDPAVVVPAVVVPAVVVPAGAGSEQDEERSPMECCSCSPNAVRCTATN